MAKILIVDDVAVNREFLISLLGYRDHVLLEAGDGAEALGIARAERPDLVICDVLMPKMDGFEFAQQLRAAPALRSVPVILSSAHYQGEQTAQLAKACGVARLLPKPCAPEEVLRIVDEVLAGAAPAVAPPDGDFDRTHLRLVTDMLSTKSNALYDANRRMSSLLELNLRLGSERDPHRLLDDVCRGARELIGAQYSALAVEEKNGEPKVYFSTSGTGPAPAPIRAKSDAHGMLSEIVVSGRSRRGVNPPGQAVAIGLPAELPDVRAYLAAPISSLSRNWGWLLLANKLGEDEFDEEDERLLSILSAQTGRIYENGSLYLKLTEHARTLQDQIAERERAQRELLRSETRFRELVEQASDGIFLSDPDGRFLLVNSSGCRMLGYTERELLSMNGRQTYVPGEEHVHAERMQRVNAGEALRFERMILRKDGSAFPAEISVKRLDSGVVQVIFHDITERRNQATKIARLSRTHALLSGINSAIVRIRDRARLFDEVCRLGLEQGQFPLVTVRLLATRDEDLQTCAWRAASDAAGRFVRQVMDSDAGKACAREILKKCKPAIHHDLGAATTLPYAREAVALGLRSLAKFPLFAEGRPAGILGLYSHEPGYFDDAEEMKLLAELAGDISFALDVISKDEKVEHLAYFDALTGLPNRRLFFERLGQSIGKLSADQPDLAVAVIDVDRFRMINETFGRHGGDALLREIARRLQASFSNEGPVARVSADRFAVSLPGRWLPGDSAHAYERHYAQCFNDPFDMAGEAIRLSATVGIAIGPGDGSEPDVLFGNAEAAMRSAKERKAPVLFYDPAMNARVSESLRLETRLKDALSNEELVLWYQPKLNLRTRIVTGLEALVRWQDPQSGLVPPAKFIPLMEQTGLILDAGRWALSRVATDFVRWSAGGTGPLRIAVNVSPNQLRQKDFLRTVIEASAVVADAGASLDLEITESVIMEDVERIIPQLQTIRGLGVEISIDDFGTGYSSLAYIAKLPINALKIDRSFVNEMNQNALGLNIVKSVISLAHSMDLKVVAEGVETQAQLDLLGELDCDEVQGYLISRPVPPETVPALIDSLRNP